MTTDLHKLHNGFVLGTLVQTVDGVGSVLYGVVTGGGAVRLLVTWQDGRRQSLHRDRWHRIEHVPGERAEKAREALRRVNPRYRGEKRLFELAGLA